MNILNSKEQIRVVEKIALRDIENHLNIPLSDNTINICSKLSLTTSCMNRNEYLEKALPTWIRLPFKEIIIVDWSSIKQLKPIIDKYQNGKIKLVRVEGHKNYNHSAARNFKVKMCSSDYVLSIDSDVMLSNKFARNVKLDPMVYYIIQLNLFGASGVGTSIIHKDDYWKVNGCNERMEGWGYEDYDLYLRLKSKGCIQKHIEYTSLYHMTHGDDKRIENTLSKDKWHSNSENTYIAARYFNDTGIKEMINPYTVYNPSGKIEIFNNR